MAMCVAANCCSKSKVFFGLPEPDYVQDVSMKIMFVSGNQEKLPDAVVPLGLLYIMANTPDCHERELVDLCFESEPFQALANAIRNSEPDLIAISMRNIQNNDYTGLSDNLNYYARLVAVCKECTAAPVVLGGAGFSVMPRELMERLDADYGISGEGEHAFPQLVAALDRGDGLDRIGALFYRETDKITGQPEVKSVPAPPDFLDMSTLAAPDRSIIDRRYFGVYGMDSVQTKRGCPLRCDYCTYPIIEGRKGRLRSAEAVVDEMFASAEQNPDINHFFIVDSVFNLPKNHAKRVCREMIARNWQIPWSCYANPLGFDQEFADLASAAGCAGMEIGSDSGCDEVLKRLHKGFTVEHVRNLHEICTIAGVPDCHTFILGTKDETIDDSRRTLDFLANLDPFAAIIMVWTDDYESLQPELRKQRLALRSEIEDLLRSIGGQYPHWSMPGLGVNFSEDLFARLRAAGMHGPLWQHVRGPQRKRRQRQSA
jgi:radical SAM superfamily enzyme YgiQ (UPF0313 family)